MKNITMTPTFKLFATLALGVFIASHSPAVAETTDADDHLALVNNDAVQQQDMDTDRGTGGDTTNVTTVTSNQTITSTSSGNTVNAGGNINNGPISVGNNFGGSGFGSFVLNTGNNATINSGVSLSVNMGH